MSTFGFIRRLLMLILCKQALQQPKRNSHCSMHDSSRAVTRIPSTIKRNWGLSSLAFAFVTTSFWRYETGKFFRIVSLPEAIA